MGVGVAVSGLAVAAVVGATREGSRCRLCLEVAVVIVETSCRDSGDAVKSCSRASYLYQAHVGKS